MNKEVLHVVDAVSYEQGVSREDMFKAIENAIAAATPRQYGQDIVVRVAIDRDTGDYESFRQWQVVADPDQTNALADTGNTDSHARDNSLSNSGSGSGDNTEFNPDKHLTLTQARGKKPEAVIGDIIEEPIPSLDFGRIGVQHVRQILRDAVRKARQSRIAEAYQHKIGTLMTGTVKRVNRDNLVLELFDGTEALLQRDQLIPREAIRVGDKCRAYLYAAELGPKGAQLLMSRTCKEMLMALFTLEVPEIGEEIIEIKGAARDPGSRAKIAVKTNDGRIDPVGACVGMRGTRVQTVSNELASERVDIVLWDPDPVQFVINALTPAEVASVMVDEDTHTMDVAVKTQDQISMAIGKSGQNVRLASELTGWRLNVMTEQEAHQKKNEEKQDIIQHFVEHLGVDEDVAALLSTEGFSSIEEIAYVALEELLAIEDFDEEIAKSLQDRAKDVLLTQAIVDQEHKNSPSSHLHELLTLEGMTPALAAALVKQGVKNGEDLAEQSVDDLMSIEGMTREKAAELIMTARKPWFQN